MSRVPQTGETYRHFKNKMYQIVGVATHSETREPLVIYQALYGDYGIYARPLDMFVSEVDHVKYPEVKQKYRFTKVRCEKDGTVVYLEEHMENNGLENNEFENNQLENNQPKNNQLKNNQLEKSQSSESYAEGVTISETYVEEGIDPKFMAFLDAQELEEKYKILQTMQETITNQQIDSMAVSLDLVIEDGPITKRYDELKNAIRMRQRYEYANRLR